MVIMVIGEYLFRRFCMFLNVFRYFSITFCFLSFLNISPVFALMSSESFWAQKEKECHGDLASMLREVEKLEEMPQLRNTRSAQDMIIILKNNGRFQELGLTNEEGEILVHALYEKLGIDMGTDIVRDNDTPAVPEADEPKADEPVADGKDDSSALSYRAGQEFENLSAVLLRWPFDWAARRGEWAQMVEALWYADVTVYLWVNAEYQKENALTYLTQQGIHTDHTRWVIESTNAVWMRDYGPQFLYDNNSDRWGLVDFHYLDSRPLDDDTPAYIAWCSDGRSPEQRGGLRRGRQSPA